MGRSPCCEKVGIKKGPWTPEEDQKLLAYIEEHGHGSWRALPIKAGLQRCGKSCRLRWTNYLRPDIKRGKFSLQEEQTIIQLHALLGNRWSAIATHLPKRTDNEIKNYWNTHLKKRLAKMGIDPITHKPKNDALLSSDGQSKNAANLSHMAQWESARLEAEARLVRESKLRSRSFQNHLSSSDQFPPGPSLNKSAGPQLPPPHPSVADILNKSAQHFNKASGIGCDLESPTSTLTFSENAPPIMITSSHGQMSTAVFVGTSGSSVGVLLKEGGEHDWKGFENSSNMPQYKESVENSISFTSNLQEMGLSMEGTWTTALRTDSENLDDDNAVDEGFTNLLLNDSNDRSLSDGGGDSGSGGSNVEGGHNDYEDSKNYWNSILDLVNSSPSDSPMF